MNTNSIPKEELLNMAKNTTSIELLSKLTKSVDSTIRRAVARNKNATASILEGLATDPVANVSYMAVNNPNCNIKREFNTTNPCVFCEKDERTMVCTDCTTLKDYYTDLIKK